MTLLIVNSEAQFKEIENQTLTKNVIFFWMTPWSNICKKAQKVIQKISLKQKTWLFVVVDCDKYPDFSDAYAVQTIPTFTINNSETDEYITFNNMNALTKYIKEY